MIYLPPLSKWWLIKVNGLKVTYIRPFLKSFTLAHVLISLMKTYLETEATFVHFEIFKIWPMGRGLVEAPWQISFLWYLICNV